jgi:cell wall-associated NlpC family hydrolase
MKKGLFFFLGKHLNKEQGMIIKRGALFITITLLLLFPWYVYGAESKKVSKKNPSNTVKTAKNKKESSAKVKAKDSKSSSKRTVAKKRRSRQLAHETPVKPKDAPPLLKITPLDNGKFLLEPMDSSLNNNDKGTEALSLIKKPVFEEGLTKNETEEEGLKFSSLLVKISEQLLGTSYRFGGTGQGGGIDCSGFVKKIYQAVTLSLPHSSREQAKMGSLVTTEWDLSRLKIGDLLFFKRGRGAINHTGMYIGDGKMIHSASKKGVVISNLESSNYYNRNFVMAKRLFMINNPEEDKFKEFKETKDTYTSQTSLKE